jgi:hypothetical protein
MRKSTIFISAALTTFALVMLYGVVSAYRGIVSPTAASVPEPTPVTVAASAPTSFTPEQAAQMASQVLGRTDLLSAESSSINGVNAYKITFVSGDVVYVGLDGQILSIQPVPQVITVQAQSFGQSGGGGGQEHEGGEHEGGD